MKILLGTTSDQKASILREAVGDFFEYDLITYDVDSGITDQPLDIETTIQGAVNRAQNSIIEFKKNSENDDYFGVGLEGGLVDVDGVYNLVCVAAFINQRDNIGLGISEYILLPEDVSNSIKEGLQFGEVIRDFQESIKGSNNQELKERVENLINRKQSFTEAITRAISNL